MITLALALVQLVKHKSSFVFSRVVGKVSRSRIPEKTDFMRCRKVLFCARDTSKLKSPTTISLCETLNRANDKMCSLNALKLQVGDLYTKMIVVK